MATEFEIKLAAEPAVLMRIALDPQIEALTRSRELLRMESLYFDTADGDLAARRWTLRQRRENDQTVVTCKTPAPGYARGEWELEGSLADAARLVGLGAPAELAELLKKPLQPVCGASFLRIAQRLTLEDGTAAELALDAGYLLRGERRQAFYEVETELKSGDPATVQAFAAVLRERYGLREERRSKFARARTLE